ncbi:unnamed protein product [Camellia sinensis]
MLLRWRLFCLAFGFVLLLLAPVVSSWVPFYYSSSMAVGVFLVIIILLFQVSIFVLLEIVVAGAALGYWMVWKFVISDDVSVDVGVAQFVKWAMCIIAATFIFQSTLDTPLAMGALASCWSICFLVTSFNSTITFGNSIYSANGNPWRSRGRANVRHNRAEFLSRSGMVASRGTLWNSPRRSSGWSESPVKGMISPTSGRNFTQESTRHAVAELASSPKFTDWIIKHPNKIQLLPDDNSDNTIRSGSLHR